MSQPLHMWKYWSEECGVEVAAERYYIELFHTDDQLRNALAQLKNAKLAIHARMKQLADEAPEDES